MCALNVHFSLSSLQLITDFSFYVLLFSLLIILIAFFLSFFQSRRFVKEKLTAFDAFLQGSSQFEKRNIEHLPQLINMAEDSKDNDLTKVLRLVAKESERLYLGKWVPEAKSYINYQSLIPPSKRRALRPEISLNLLAIGVLASLIIILIPYINDVPISIQFAAIPLFVSLFLSALSFINNKKYYLLINDKIAELKMAYAHLLPEYSERSGTALLIDEFLQYERKMADSSRVLSEKVEELNDQKLIDTVASSIEKVLERQIAPALSESNKALSNLCVELTNRQTDGMSQLAREFSSSLSETIKESMKPMESQVAHYTATVFKSHNSLDLAFKQFEQYRDQATALDQQITAHIELLSLQSKQWNEGLSGLQKVSEQISANNVTMTKLQAGSEETLAGKLAMMASSIEEFGRMNNETLQNLRKENELLNQLLLDTQTESNKVLSEYRHLTQRITISAMDIEKHNGEISANIEKLSTGLNESVKIFTSQIQSGVDITLSDFDAGLAELTERLSHSATAIRDSVARLVDAVSDGND